MRVTRHAEQRTRERVGLPKRAVNRTAGKALKQGRHWRTFSGSFKRYLHLVYLKQEKANNMRVYNGHLYLFDDDVLITVFEVPEEYRGCL